MNTHPVQSPGTDLGVAVLSPQRRVRVQRKTVAVLSAATILSGLGVGASLSVGALLLAEVSGNDAISGLGSAMFNAGAAAAGIPLARLAMKRGRRRALVTGSLIAMVGSIVAIWGSEINKWGVLALGIAMVGVASATQLLARFTAADLALPHNRGRDLSLVVWSITVGAVVGPNLLAPGEALGSVFGFTPLAGVFIFPIVAQALAALVNVIGLRPDPLLAARALQAYEDAQAAEAHNDSGRELTADEVVAVESSPHRSQVMIILAIAMAQAIMVALMAMTPLHLMHHEGTPQIVGLTLSLHIAGMYALSPVFGIMTGRIGSQAVLALGWVVLLGSIVMSYIAGASHLLVQAAMILLGLGWSMVTVAGATLLTEITPAPVRPRWQGRSDATMSASGALAGALSGIVFAIGDFSFLALATGALLALGVVASIRLRIVHRRSHAVLQTA